MNSPAISERELRYRQRYNGKEVLTGVFVPAAAAGGHHFVLYRADCRNVLLFFHPMEGNR